MSAAVVLSRLAESDLKEIWVFTAQDDPGAADRLIDLIHEKCRMLAARPRAGRARPELAPAVRSFAVGNYVIFYRAGKTGVEIARVLHGRRDLPPLFRS